MYSELNAVRPAQKSVPAGLAVGAEEHPIHSLYRHNCFVPSAVYQLHAIFHVKHESPPAQLAVLLTHENRWDEKVRNISAVQLFKPVDLPYNVAPVRNPLSCTYPLYWDHTKDAFLFLRFQLPLLPQSLDYAVRADHAGLVDHLLFVVSQG